MRNRIVLLLLSMGLMGGGGWLAGCKPAGDGHEGHGGAQARQRYHCPMHPTYIKDRPGDCGICGMKLVPIKVEEAKSGSASAPPKPMAPAESEKTAHITAGQFYCPMDLNVVSNAPGRCPECHMKLIEKQEAPATHEGPTAS